MKSHETNWIYKNMISNVNKMNYTKSTLWKYNTFLLEWAYIGESFACWWILYVRMCIVSVGLHSFSRMVGVIFLWYSYIWTVVLDLICINIKYSVYRCLNIVPMATGQTLPRDRLGYVSEKLRLWSTPEARSRNCVNYP